jgi:hypothetical protein
MVKIVTCLFDGTTFGIPHSTNTFDATWVDKLYRAIKRNTTKPFELICLVDKQYPIKEPVKQVSFNEQADVSVGWSLLAEMYRPDITNDRRITIGLDTIIMDNIDDILDVDSDIAMITDPYYTKEVCNAITWCSPETATHIWDIWTNKRDWVYENCRFLGNAPSEMILLRKLFDQDGKVLRIDNIHEGIYSYKAHIVHNPDLIEKSKIIYFHGAPKPHELGVYPVDDLITPHWR